MYVYFHGGGGSLEDVILSIFERAVKHYKGRDAYVYFDGREGRRRVSFNICKGS
jgi:hypothetical protein